MKYVFVETEFFMKQRDRHLIDDDEFRRLQDDLSRKSGSYPRIRDCGGLRKLRWGDARRRKGKRGGIRVLYLDVPLASDEAKGVIFLVSIYGKDEKDDLTPQDKNVLRGLVRLLKQDALLYFERESNHGWKRGQTKGQGH